MNSFGFYAATDASVNRARTNQNAQQSNTNTSRLRELEQEVMRLKLLNQALWEMVREKASLTYADFEAKVQEVDMRDGVADGKMSETPVRCPTCSRVSNSKHYKCLYCGQEFEKPVMG